MLVSQSLLQVSDVNCFSVNWNNGAHALYPQAANNVRVVGAELALFIDSLLVGTIPSVWGFFIYFFPDRISIWCCNILMGCPFKFPALILKETRLGVRRS